MKDFKFESSYRRMAKIVNDKVNKELEEYNKSYREKELNVFLEIMDARDQNKELALENAIRLEVIFAIDDLIKKGKIKLHNPHYIKSFEDSFFTETKEEKRLRLERASIADDEQPE